jgi:transcriptional regulator with XRE-family HTH domain
MDQERQKTIAVLVKEKQQKLGLSDRGMAEEMGIAHATVRRIREGDTLDIETIRKIGDWLGVSPLALLAEEGIEKDALAAQIAAVLETEPQLASVFSEAMDRVLDGQMDPAVFRELATYAAYRLNLNKEKDVQ